MRFRWLNCMQAARGLAFLPPFSRPDLIKRRFGGKVNFHYVYTQINTNNGNAMHSFLLSNPSGFSGWIWLHMHENDATPHQRPDHRADEINETKSHRNLIVERTQNDHSIWITHGNYLMLNCLQKIVTYLQHADTFTGRTWPVIQWDYLPPR